VASIPDEVNAFLKIGVILPAALWRLGKLGLYNNVVPKIFLGIKGGRCIRLTTTATREPII
jgi:hypothetical protein